MTEQLNGQTLPDGWEWVDVGRLIDVRTGATPLRSNSAYWQDGTIPWVTSGALNHLYIEQADEYITPLAISETNAKLFPAGSLLVAMYGEGKTRGKISELKIDAATNQACAALIFDHVTECLKSYIKLYFLKNYQDIRLLSSGGVQPNLNLSIIKQTQIPLAPLNEQRRIVAAIETQFTRLDAAVTALKRSQANLKRYRAAVLKAACEGRLVPTEAALAQAEGRAYEPAAVLLERILAERRRKWEAENPKRQYQEPVVPDINELLELPEGWKGTQLQYISDTVSVGHVGPTSEYYCSSDEGVAFLRSQNVRPGRLSWTGLQYVTQEFHKLHQKSRLQSGDLLVVRVGANRGDACIVPDNACELNCANIIFARPASAISAFLKVWFQTEACRNHMLSMTTGSAQGVINTSSVEKVLIPLPPIAEQQRIVTEVERRLSLIDQLEKTIEADLARANRLRQSILKRAFEGKLVPQDSTDEPAAVLLERIKAAKHDQPVLL